MAVGDPSDPSTNTFHFTYRAPKAADDLRQGDLLAKTTEISSVLQEIHPHYHRKEDYTHFVVLTQSCDLVRRGGKPCKTKYVSLAAVRPLSVVITRDISRHQDDFDRRAGVCSQGKRQLLEQFVEKVLNNNEPEYFYLHPEPAFGLHQPSCAFLRLSVAVRAEDHYAKLLAARQLCLEGVFQAKLGWLIGNMYSRVGTEDWVPRTLPESEFKKKLADHLNEVVRWVDPEQLKAAKKNDSGAHLSQEQMRDRIQQTKAPKKKDKVLDAVLRVLRAQGLVSDDKAAVALRTRIENDPDLAGLLK